MTICFRYSLSVLAFAVTAALLTNVTTQARAQGAAAPAAPAPAAGAKPAAAPPEPTAQPEPAKPLPPVLAPEINETISRVVTTMEGAEKSLNAMTTVDTDLGRLRDDLDGVISRTTQTADELRPRLADLRGQLDRLGPPPDKAANPEVDTVTAERARLEHETTELSGAVKTLEVTWWRARQAIDKITDIRLQIFFKSLTERKTSPLFPALWSDFARDLPAVAWRWNYNTSDWLSTAGRHKGALALLVAAALALYLALRVAVARVTRYQPGEDGQAPTFFERAASASWIGPARAIPGVLTAVAVYVGLDYIGLLYYPTAAPTGASALRSVLIFTGVASLLSAVFAPRDPARRLFNLSNRSARRVCRLLVILAAIYALDIFLSDFGQTLYFPLSMTVVQSLLASLAFAGVLVGLLVMPFEPMNAKADGIAVHRDRPRWLKIPLWFAAAVIIAACLLGYVALGRFAAQQIVMTGVVGLVALLLFLAIRAFTRDGGTGHHHHVGSLLEQRFGIDAPRRQQLAWLTEAALTLTVVIVALPLLMLQWGFSSADIRDWVKSALFGFEIGQFKISLVRILIGILLFTALLFVTRLIQRRLRENVLIQPKLDPGIANSIDQAIGYAGTAFAAIIAISYAGFDITNLAIVAGALSVGIGFGLQSIVNNFVSGLILLIERPIKVGDWVVVGNEQGNVKRISVRSTEIETFDRASLIVPNSELVTGRVLNWTHRNALGRVVLKFTAGPGADPRKVIALLSRCAEAHPDVLAEPAPLAVFESYSAAGTEYSLRILLGDIHKGMRVQSELRVAVFEALKTADLAPPETAAAAPPLVLVSN